jgi:NADP-dependent 3-hydroxy acid dehydrogenase YdfG
VYLRLVSSGESDTPNRVAVVTGAGSGIGAETAIVLAGAGYRVALAGRRAETLNTTADRCPQAMVVPADVTDDGAVTALFDAVRDRWGRVDVLVNNAATFGATAEVGEYPIEAWRQVIDTNLTGAFLCARAAFAIMKDQGGGRIINVGSLSAQVPRPHAVAYTASKHALTGLTRAIALDGRAHGIACGQIDIGNVVTELSRAIQQGALQADGSLLAEPMMDVRGVADGVLYMANLPLTANVGTLTVMATRMPFAGRG